MIIEMTFAVVMRVLKVINRISVCLSHSATRKFSEGLNLRPVVAKQLAHLDQPIAQENVQ
jgi:hypothetical protein